MRFHTSEDLGPKQSLLPSGALLCHDTVIARTGLQIYATDEIGIDPDDDTIGTADGIVAVMRDEDEVFSERAMASFEGVPITLRHPTDAVDPGNWSRHAVGHIANVRRSGDVLVADLLIHDAKAINLIRNKGWRSVSLGYDASYQPAGGGRLRQIGITGNHCAILPPGELARCGDVCSIGDAVPTRKDRTMDGYTFWPEAEVDAIMRRRAARTHDQDVVRQPARKSAGSGVGTMGYEGTEFGAQRADPREPGAVLVEYLDGPASAFFVATAGDGRAALFRSRTISGKLDTGTTFDAMRRVGVSEQAIRLRARDAAMRAQSGVALADINRRNREYWAKR